MSIIGFIGLGQMGTPMAANLIRKGHQLTVFDINAKAADPLLALGAKLAKTPGEAASGADFLITMLPNGDIVEAALFGEGGAVEKLSANALCIDMSTIHPLHSDKICKHMNERGLSFMDAPVGRTSDQALTGQLLILAGGTPAQVERSKPILMCMGSDFVDAGGPGMGIRIKIINNTMSIALNALSAEVAVLCEALGLSLDIAIGVMSGTAAGKGHFTTGWPNKVLKGDLTPAFMVDLAHKDLGIALDVANQVKAPSPLVAASREIYNQARADGRGRQDWSAILSHLRKAAGRPDNL